MFGGCFGVELVEDAFEFDGEVDDCFVLGLMFEFDGVEEFVVGYVM